MKPALRVRRLFPGRYEVRAAGRTFLVRRTTHRGVCGIETAVTVAEVGTFHAYVTAATFAEAKTRLAEKARKGDGVKPESQRRRVLKYRGLLMGALALLRDGGTYELPDVREDVLDGAKRLGLVTCRYCAPQDAMLWRITEAGKARLASYESQTPGVPRA